MKDDLFRIQAAIRAVHRCDCRHHSTTLVSEHVAGQTWSGRVEIWSLVDHPRTTYCYGWREADDEITTVLQIPPVISPQSAVRSVLNQRNLDAAMAARGTDPMAL